MAEFVLFVTLILIVAILNGQQHIFVSQNGSDYDECGQYINASCATMYYSSTLLSNHYDTIYVIDGQNKNAIKEYSKSNNGNDSVIYNPCVPKTHINISYNLIFDNDNIKNMNDWFYPP
eukprot:265294_1